MSTIESTLRSYFKSMYPNASTEYLEGCIDSVKRGCLTKFGITTNERFDHFNGQGFVECEGFRQVEENMNYSATRLFQIFGVGKNSAALTFSECQALQHNPQAIAERVYGTGRKAQQLGNLSPRDGWIFKGRGFLNTTGRYNANRVQQITGFMAAANPNSMIDPKTCYEGGMATWMTLGGNKGADAGSVSETTKIINGGHIQEADRENATSRSAQIRSQVGLDITSYINRNTVNTSTVSNESNESTVSNESTIQPSSKILTARAGVNLVDVDQRLKNILIEACNYLPLGCTAQFISGKRTSDTHLGGKSFHLTGKAIDITIYKNGIALPNYQNGLNFRTYEIFAQNAKKIQSIKYPELNTLFAWGGYFTSHGSATGYGANDTMHFDIGGARGVAGNWEEGLNSRYRGIYDAGGSKSVGMGSITSYKLQTDKKELNPESPLIPVEPSQNGQIIYAKHGSKGPIVGLIQERLNALGYYVGTVDEVYGTKTEASIFAFQRDHNLKRDGIVGPKTSQLLGVVIPQPTPKRMETTTKDLKKEGSRTIETTSNLKRILIFVGGLFGISESNIDSIFDWIKEKTSDWGTTDYVDGIKNIFKFIQEHPAILILLTFIITYIGLNLIEKFRVEDHRSGANLSR